MWDIIIWYDNTVDFVPSEWANDDCTKYKYPEGLSESKIRKLIYECKNLTKHFKWCDARLKTRSIKDLKKARELCSKAEHTSNFESDDDTDNEEQEKSRKRKRPRRLIEDDEDDCNIARKKTASFHAPQSQEYSSEEDDTHDSRALFKIPPLPKSQCNSPAVIEGARVCASEAAAISTSTCSGASSDNGIRSGSTLTISSNEDISETRSFRPTPLNRNNLLHNSLKFELQEINKRLDRIENSLLLNTTANVSTEKMNSILTLLPVNTTDQFENVDSEVRTNEIKRQELVNVFSLLGGDIPRKTVFLIMNKIFGKKLATEYSGQGKKKKKSFSTSILYNVVIAATRKRHTQATEEEIKRNISLFLASAKQRLPKDSGSEELIN